MLPTKNTSALPCAGAPKVALPCQVALSILAATMPRLSLAVKIQSEKENESEKKKINFIKFE